MKFVLLALFLLLLVDPIQDYILIRQNKNINHKEETMGVALLAIAILIGGAVAGLGIFKMAALGVSFPAVRWIVHDHMLNLLRGKFFNYVGLAAKTDQFLTVMHNQFNIPPILTRLFFLSYTLLISFKLWYLN